MGFFNLGTKEKSGESTFHKGQQVVFFHGRRPMKGVIEETQDDGRVVVLVKGGEGTIRILKDADEIKPLSEVKGKHAKIRFI